MLDIFRSIALEICHTMNSASSTAQVVRLSDLNDADRHSVIHEIARIETLLNRMTESESSLKSA